MAFLSLPFTCISSWLALMFGVVWISALPMAHAETLHQMPDGERVSESVLNKAVAQYLEVKNREQTFGRDSHEVALGVRNYHEILANAGVRQSMVALGNILITGGVSNWHASLGRLTVEERDIPRGLELLKSAASLGCHYRSPVREGKCEGKRLSIPELLRDCYRDGVVDYQTDHKLMGTCLAKNHMIQDARELLRMCKEKSSEKSYRWQADQSQARYWEEKAQTCEEEIARLNSEHPCD